MNIVLVLPRFITSPCPPHLVRQLECFSLTASVAKAEETCDEMSNFLEVLVDNMFNPGASSKLRNRNLLLSLKQGFSFCGSVLGSFRCSPGCQQSQLSPVSCSPREAEARLWWEAPGSSLPSLKRFWIAWGFKIRRPAPSGKRWPNINIVMVFPKPVGRAQRIWFFFF